MKFSFVGSEQDIGALIVVENSNEIVAVTVENLYEVTGENLKAGHPYLTLTVAGYSHEFRVVIGVGD
jgi:hypothetical protein